MKQIQILSHLRSRFYKIILASLLLFGIAHLSYAQQPSEIKSIEVQEAQNQVTISSPKDGEKVGSYVIVEGNSTIHDNSHVWILVHRKDLTDQWWPQDKPKIFEGGSWMCAAYIGQKRDIGYDFEIAVATFDENEEKKIQKYHEIGKKLEQWLPIKFPQKTSNVDLVTVKKTSH